MNHSLRVEWEPLEALVLSTIVKRFYLLDLDLGIGNIMGNHLRNLEVDLRVVSFFLKPTSSLDASYTILVIVIVSGIL
jgi:hypothetical protein